MEGQTVTLQDLLTFDFLAESEDGKIRGEHNSTGVKPKFWDRARYFGLEEKLANALGLT